MERVGFLLKVKEKFTKSPQQSGPPKILSTGGPDCSADFVNFS